MARRATGTPAAPTVALAATLHDATGALAGDLRRWLPALRRLYGTVAVATSPVTAPRIRALLAAAGCDAGAPTANARGPLYRRALSTALRGDTSHVHYLDLDRALHWAATRPRELAALVRTPHADVLLVGRTAAAHRSHHRPLVETETVANRTLAAEAGLRGRIDFLVPSFLLARVPCARLLARSRARGSAIYGELAALLLAAAPTLDYVECRGLDWETPDRDRRGVARLGLARWRARWDTPAEWALRYALAADVVRGFVRTRTRYPSRPRFKRV